MEINDTVIAEAARLFGTEASKLHLLGGMDGLAYDFERNGSRYVLKVAPFPADHPEHPAKMQEKFEFVSYLAEKGVRVAQPIPSINNIWVETIQSPQGGYVASAATLAPGHHVDRRNPAEINSHLFQNWGQVTGRMHALAKQYKTWRTRSAESDPPTDIMDWRMEHRSFRDWCQDDAVRAKWDQLGERLALLPQKRDCYGLIHNDLHPANFLVEDGEITVIDFDVCSYHWFATDIAIALFFADWGGPPSKKQSRREFLFNFYLDFMIGYSRENTLEGFWIKQLPQFLKHHQILLYIGFSNEWKGGTNRWQTSQLGRWRSSILNDLPVVAIDF